METERKNMEPAETEADRERRWHEQFKRMQKARARIVEVTKGARDVAGVTECPNCGANLRYTVSGYNGHIHAACVTEGCARWIE